MFRGSFRALSVLLFLVFAVSLGGLARAGESCATCEQARQANGWCDACGTGYVGGVALSSRHLWHILDAHGHKLNLDNLGCKRCSAAVEVDGYCPESRIGFVNREAYFSRLTWLLATAEGQPTPEPGCPACGRDSGAARWCEDCGIGRVGRYLLNDRQQFQNLVHDLEILAIANEVSTRCEHCAVAIVTDTECPICRVRYRDGQPLERQEPDE